MTLDKAYKKLDDFDNNKTYYESRMIKSIGFYRKMFRLSRKIHHVFDVKIFSKINTFSNDEWNYIDRYITKFVRMNTTIDNAQYEILNQILSRRIKRS